MRFNKDVRPPKRSLHQPRRQTVTLTQSNYRLRQIPLKFRQIKQHHRIDLGTHQFRVVVPPHQRHIRLITTHLQLSPISSHQITTHAHNGATGTQSIPTHFLQTKQH